MSTRLEDILREHAATLAYLRFLKRYKRKIKW